MYTNPQNERLEFLVISMMPVKLIPRLGLSVKTVAMKATTKPRIVPIKSLVPFMSFSKYNRILTEHSA
jgi:hypothetical protein